VTTGILTGILILLVHCVAHADGIHVVVIEQYGDDLWLAHEFIDYAIVSKLAFENEDGSFALEPSIVFHDDIDSGKVDLINAESQALMLFVSENVAVPENRILSAQQESIADEIESETNRQIIRGLFAVPFWPFLAASEVPFRRVELERLQFVQHRRDAVLPVEIYGSTSFVDGWEVSFIDSSRAYLERSEPSGDVSGIKLDYFINSDLPGAEIAFSGSPEILALYTVDNGGWEIRDLPYEKVSVAELVGLSTGWSKDRPEKTLVSIDRVSDSDGNLTRYAMMPGKDKDVVGIAWKETGETFFEPVAAKKINVVAVALACWLLFGFLFVIFNLLFRFADNRPHELMIKSMAIYPIYILASFLLVGFWGLGFIAGAMLSARFISSGGRIFLTFCAVLASSFAVAVISILLV